MKRALFLLPLAASCAWEPGYDQSPQLLPPVALSSQLALVEASNARVFFLDPAHPEARARVVPVGAKAPVLATRRQGKEEVLVLSRGDRGEPGVAPEPAALSVISSDPATPPRVLPLGSRFNALAQSDDGRFLIASFGPQTMAGDALFNPNEIAVVDLMAPNPVVPRTIRSFGSVPAGVVFSPPMNLPDGPRDLAVILSENFVTLLDLDHPTRPEITVPLTLPDDHRSLRPVQVLFEAKDPAIYVRASAANDIYALRLLPVAPAERAPDGNDFTPALSQLAAGTGPADMALYDSADGPRLLVVSTASSDAFVIDARTSRSTRIALDEPASRIHLFEGTGPGDPMSRPRALLIGTGLTSRSISFLDLEQLELLGRRNLDSRSMGAPALDSLFFPARGLAVVLHRAAAGTAGVSVIDLAQRTVAPIFAEVPPSRLAAAPDKIWVGPESGSRLGFLDLGTLAPGEVRLDAPITGIVPLAKGTDGKNRVVVIHGGDPAGSVTVLDGDQPKRATARAIEGFLLQDLLERGDR